MTDRSCVSVNGVRCLRGGVGVVGHGPLRYCWGVAPGGTVGEPFAVSSGALGFSGGGVGAAGRHRPGGVCGPDRAAGRELAGREVGRWAVQHVEGVML